jgi:hypothetical protein
MRRSPRGKCAWRFFETGCLHIFGVYCIYVKNRVCGLILDNRNVMTSIKYLVSSIQDLHPVENGGSQLK